MAIIKKPGVKLTLSEFIDRAREVHFDEYDYSKSIYINYMTKLEIICKIHGSFFQSPNTHIIGKSGCPYCMGNKTHETTSIFFKRPDLHTYFKDIEDAKKITCNSNKKVDVICPTCKMEKKIIAQHLTKRGIMCTTCSDGVSKPEKIMSYILNMLKVEYLPQYKILDESYRYDFYIPKYNAIIEMNGRQHYQASGGRFADVESIKNNDIIKKECAIKSGIMNYVEINCTDIYSISGLNNAVDDIKNNIKKLDSSLNTDIIHSNDVEMHRYIEKNRFEDIVEQYNHLTKVNNIESHEAIKIISNNLKVSVDSVRKSVKKACSLNLLEYIPRLKNMCPVYKIEHKTDNILCIYESAVKCASDNNLSKRQLSYLLDEKNIEYSLTFRKEKGFYFSKNTPENN